MSSDLTLLLSQIESGDPTAAEKLLPLVYEELRQLAAARLAGEKPGQTLQATALVHEAYLRLISGNSVQEFRGRSHFFAAAAESMRRILVDQARRKTSQKHGGNSKRQDIDVSEICVYAAPEEILQVHDALDALAAHEPQAADLVKLHYFSGFSLEEAAEILGMSRASGYRLYTFARAWLRAALEDSPKQLPI